MSLSSAFERIERWLSANHGESFFSPGNTDATGPLAPLHRRWNGQVSEDVSFYEHFHLLSADDAAREKAMMDELRDGEGWDDAWWSRAWVPFASDFAGQLICLDTESGEVLEDRGVHAAVARGWARAGVHVSVD